MQALKFDVAMNSNFQCLLFIQPIGCTRLLGDGHFPRPPDDTPLTIDSSGAYFRGESQVKGMNGFRESHPKCKQNRHSNEPGILNP